MQRRKMLAALGSVAVGGATAVSTGAFTSVEADRTVTVDVVGDASAYLGMEASSSPNGQFASGSDDDEITIDFDNSGGGSDEQGSGVNKNATATFEEVFTIRNQGTQAVEVDLQSNGNGLNVQDPGDIDPSGNTGKVSVALSDDDSDSDDEYELDTGGKVDVDFAVNSGTDDISGLELTVTAEDVETSS